MCLSVCVSNQIWSEFGRRLTFISWEFPFKENSVWLLLEVRWCSCPNVVQTVSPPVQWSHDLLTSPISSDLMVGKLKKYYFCHNSRLAAGQPEMDDIWPGVASSEILSCDNLGHRCLSLSIIILTEAEELWIMVSPFPIIFTSHIITSVWLQGLGKGRWLCIISCVTLRVESVSSVDSI